MVEKKFDFLFESQQYTCTIKIGLPSDERGLLVKELRNKNVEVLGESLNRFYGSLNEKGFRVKSRELYAQDIEYLKVEVEKEIENIIKVIKQVYKDNLEKAKVPEIETEVYVIED